MLDKPLQLGIGVSCEENCYDAISITPLLVSNLLNSYDVISIAPFLASNW